MKFDIQRLRNLTTNIIHTDISHVYEDLEKIVGEKGLMAHMLPRVNKAVEPWLRKHVADPRFWNNEWDKEHVGEIELPEPSKMDRNDMVIRYKKSNHC